MGYDDYSISSRHGGDADSYDQQSSTAVSRSFCFHEKRAEVSDLSFTQNLNVTRFGCMACEGSI
jgi:hypothetical protein